MQHHKIFRLNATLIIFRVALSFTFHIKDKNSGFILTIIDISWLLGV